MNICIINFSGNVGKSVIAQHLLKSRLENSGVIAVESINSDGTNDEKIKGKRFSEIMNRLVEHDNAIVDVGASNVEVFLQQMKKSIGAQEDFDYFIVPTINRTKQLTDTVATIEALKDMGIEKGRIKVLFNLLDEDTELRHDFSSVWEAEPMATISEKCAIWENELFNRLEEIEAFTSIQDLANNTTDYKQLIKESETVEQRRYYAQQLGLQRLAIGVTRSLDSTFNALFDVE
ncbi:stability protein StdB [Vibrio astriarenae]|nr:stability protein StdB [Vibrio sp. C7]